jgi:hypothetical protein
MWLVVCTAIAIAGVVWGIGFRVSLYRGLFADRHLVEVGEGLAALKQAALRNIISLDQESIELADDTRVLRTSADLTFLYTVTISAAGRYLHHASVSIPGRVTPHAVGETFILLWAKSLGIGYERLALGVSSATVHHAKFELTEEEQAEFVLRAVDAPTAEWLQTFRVECLRARESLRSRQIASPPGYDDAAGPPPVPGQ